MPRNLTYNQDSGQVYTETTIALKPKSALWWNNRRGKPEKPSAYRRRGVGTSSLYDAALRVCTYNAEWMTPEALNFAEWPYAERIYKRLKQQDAMTFQIWKIFHEAYPNKPELDHSYQVRVIEHAPRLLTQMTSIQRQITNLPSSALTNLSLRNLLLRPYHLNDLTNFPNLAVLVLNQYSAITVSTGESGIDERFVKRWGMFVQDKKAFSKLKVVVFRHFGLSLDCTLGCFERFPSLFLCGMEPGPPRRTKASMPKHWRSVLTKNKLHKKYAQDPQEIWGCSDRTIHQKMTDLYELARTSSSSEMDALSPITAAVSIDYGDAGSGADRPTNPAWFAREPRSPDDLAQSEKRYNDGNSLESNDATTVKKRKIRASKQTDVSSLLGLLGPS